MVKWFHKCDLDWLKARQDYLTATDIKDLLPVTKSGRKRAVTKYDYLKVLSRKKTVLTEDDCMSNGAAARGHILEPYAIDTFNTNLVSNLYLEHWDDVLVVKTGSHLAFSPDAMSCPVPDCGVVLNVDRIEDGNPITIGEVKSYNSERHFICGHTPKEELEERWQIATAMAVCDSVSTAWLLFFNPSMDIPMYIVRYSREDLADEIDIILDIENKWYEFLETNSSSAHQSLTCITTEEDIVREIVEKEKLNPASRKSVIV